MAKENKNPYQTNRIMDDYDWGNYIEGGNFSPGFNILKIYFKELKAVLIDQQKAEESTSAKVSLELSHVQFKMLLDGLERASQHEELAFKHETSQDMMKEAFREFFEKGKTDVGKGYRAACKVLGIAPGKRPAKITPGFVISRYKMFYMEDSSMRARYEAIFFIAEKAKTTPEYIIKILKTAKKNDPEICAEFKLPRWPPTIPEYADRIIY
jgi:hypothetical protein